MAAAAATAIAFALYSRVEWPWFILGWVGLVPWLAALDRIRTWRGALAAGLTMSVAFSLGVFGWFAAAIRGYTGAPWPVAILVLVLLIPFLQPQLVFFALARHWVRGRGAGFCHATLAGACAYVGSEWVSPKLFADTLGHGFHASAVLRQAADLTGAQGLTFVLVVANECVLATALALRARQLRRAASPLACVALLVVGLTIYGLVRLRQVEESERRARVVSAGLVQADVGPYAELAARRGTYDAVRTILDTHFELSRAALGSGGLDLLVWPETVYPTTFGSPKSADGADFDREIGRFVAAARLPLIFGAYDVDGGEEYNAAVFLEPGVDGQVSFDAYRKASLFPFTERVPALLDGDRMRRWFPWLGTWQPGAGPNVVPVRLGDGRVLRVAPLICYDAVDPGLALEAVRSGAELIVTLSNDSWFASGEGPHLHLVVSAFRSLETRRAQVRATNTGISAIISATGELIRVAGVHERTALAAGVAPESEMRTLMLRWGDWFGPSALAAGLFLALWEMSRRRASTSRGRGPARHFAR